MNKHKNMLGKTSEKADLIFFFWMCSVTVITEILTEQIGYTGDDNMLQTNGTPQKLKTHKTHANTHTHTHVT